MTTRTRVLIIEDDAEMREHLARTISEDARLLLCASAPDCVTARTQFSIHQPRIVLIDLGLPDGRGSDLIREFHRACPAALFMVMTALGDEAHVVEAIEAGASSYLLKDASALEVARAIQDVLAGGSPISPGVARYLLKRMQKPQAPPLEATAIAAMLSDRESEVLQLVAKGYSYCEIGRALQISVNTVGTYIRQTYRKLGVRSRGEAVFEALHQGLIVQPPQRRE